MTTAKPQSAEPKPKRRWFQYSLRTLLLLMLLASIGMSWFAVKMQRARRQREAVEAIEKLGGWVRFDYQVNQSIVLASSPPPQPPGPEWLRRVLGDDFFAKVVSADLHNTQATDAWLEHLDGLPHLQQLNLMGTPVSDAGVQHVERLGELRVLSLDSTQVTDAGLDRLRGLGQLQLLLLCNTKITDAGLMRLKGLRQLQSLWLYGTSVTDAGLEHLKELSHLQHLELSRTQVTDEGVKRFQHVMPNCRIDR